MTVVTNDIYVTIEDNGEQVLNVDLVTNTDIQIEVGETGPPGSGLGTLLQDYSIKGQLFTWAGGNVHVNVDNGNTAQISLDADTTLDPISGWPGIGEEGKLTLYIQQNGSVPHDVTWPVGVLWINGKRPVLSTVNGRWDVIVLTTVDSGSVVFGFHVGTT